LLGDVRKKELYLRQHSVMEQDLIRQLHEGNPDAFDCIYAIYAPRLLAYCRRQVDCEDEAEDLVQEVFVALWRNRENIRNRETLQPLLFTALRNRIVNLWKARINSRAYSDYVEFMNDGQATSGTPHIEYSEFEQVVLRCVESLPKTQGEVIRLSRFENLSNEEIAASLGLSLQTVKNALSAGLKTLRAMVDRIRQSRLLILYGFIINVLID